MDLPITKLIDVPPVWLAGFAGVVWLAGAWMPLMPGNAILHGIGMILIALGLSTILLVAWQFRRHRTTIIPHQNASSLVTGGLFRWSRNPIYVGDAMILAGLCLRWDAAFALILVPVFMAVITRRFILGEEERLRTVFGAEFDGYAARTGRWL